MKTRSKLILAGGFVAAVTAVNAVIAALGNQGSDIAITGPADCPAVGDRCADGTVYIGARELADQEGRALGDFYLFAAPEDLRDDQGNRLRQSFGQTVEYVAGLRGWHGHNGGYFNNDAAVYAAIAAGRYGGEWFIPPAEVLVEDLYGNRDRGVLRGTFNTFGGTVDSARYWSSTDALRDLSTHAYVVNFTDDGGPDGWLVKGSSDLASRLVRAAPTDAVAASQQMINAMR